MDFVDQPIHEFKKPKIIIVSFYLWEHY